MLSWILMLAAQVAAAPAPPQPQKTTTANLDALLTARQYGLLGERIGHPADQAETFRNGDWLRARMIGGSSAFVALMYSRWLWTLGEAIPT